VARLAILLAGMAIGATAVWALQPGHHNPLAPGGAPARPGPSPPRETPAKRSVFALGTLEPRGGAVLVTSALVGTPIREVLVREGQTVKTGERLILLDTTVPDEELRIATNQRAQAVERQQSEISLAKQRQEAAALALTQAQDAPRLELETQKKQVEVAEAKLEQAEGDLARLEKIDHGERPLISAQQLGHQKTLVKLAHVERDAAGLAFSRIEQALQFQLQKAQTEKKAADESRAIAERGSALTTLDRQIKLAEHKLALTRVTAPSSGTVISLMAHPGELISTQPLMQIANLTALECLAEVDVADLSLLKDKHDALISCRAFRGTKIKATIERIRNVAGAATLRKVDPRNNVDRTVATIVLKVDAAEAAQLIGGNVDGAAAALMGLQVDVEIPL
jgi:HlyD family secretion protein